MYVCRLSLSQNMIKQPTRVLAYTASMSFMCHSHCCPHSNVESLSQELKNSLKKLCYQLILNDSTPDRNTSRDV